jgi:uncharacterized membrane protein YfcA
MEDLNNIPLELYPLFFVIAVLYSSIGHGGASGYLALFALFGLTAPTIAPIALILNILVASASFWRYRAADHFSFKMLLPFVVLSVPAAFVGGAFEISRHLFTLVLGAALMVSAIRILIVLPHEWGISEPPGRTLWRAGLPIGAALGLISGMTGIGGGVFLSPVLIFMRWATVKRSAALASAFIVLNSVSGLTGQLTRVSISLSVVLPLALVVTFGGVVGAYAGAERFKAKWLQVILSVILFSAGLKLLIRST